VVNDLRSAWRAISRSPGLVAVIVASLAIGAGANAAVYSAIDALLFRGTAGVSSPSALVDVYTSQITGATYGESSFPDFQSIAQAGLGLLCISCPEGQPAHSPA